MGSVDVWILPGFLNSKDSKLRNAQISKQWGHDIAFYSVDIVLYDFEV
jgi:hypothetical protein